MIYRLTFNYAVVFYSTIEQATDSNMATKRNLNIIATHLFFPILHHIEKLIMAKHNVFFNLPRRELGKTDIVFEVFSDLEKFGTITISKGALEWWPSYAKKPFRMDWTRFDRAIREHYGY
jgi:hypothetical protein